MKRGLIFVACLAGMATLGLSFPAFSEGAGEAEMVATGEPKSLVRFWTLAGVVQLAPTEEVVAKFEREFPEIDVEITPCGNWEDLHKKCLAAIAAGDPPEMRRAKPYHMADYASRGVLLVLDELIERDGVDLSKYPDVVTKYENAYMGKLVVMPWYSSTPVLYYNTELFAEVGLTEPPETWDEAVSYAKKLTDPAKKRWGYIPNGYGPSTGSATHGWLPLNWQAGGEYFNEGYTKTLVNDPPGIEALQYTVDLVFKHKVTPPIDRIDPMAITAGRVGLWGEGQWAIPRYAKEAPQLKYTTALWPKHPQTGKYTCLSMAGGLSIFKDSKNTEDAWKLVKFLTRPESETAWCKGAGFIPASRYGKGIAPFDTPPYEAHVENYTTDVGVRPVMPKYGEVYDAIGKGLQTAWYGQKSPKQALDEAAATVNKILSEIEW
jgi:multiple sugar transport system substrate-binding protein